MMLCPRWTLSAPDGTPCRTDNPACTAYRSVHCRMAAGIDVFCAPSRFLLDRHRPYLPDSVACRLIPNGIPLKPGTRAETRGGITRFLFLGQLTAVKGVGCLLDAFVRLDRAARVELHIAGAGPLQSRVEAAAAADPRIIFHGFITGDRKAKIIEDADALVFPSIWVENGPYALMEAAQAGLALVGSAIGAIPEFIEDGVDGLLLPPGQPEAWAAALAGLALDPDRLGTMGRAAMRRAAAYDEARMIDAYIALYESHLYR
jgi:glycosyltransferase involved in cell wall biosynthesis